MRSGGWRRGTGRPRSGSTSGTCLEKSCWRSVSGAPPPAGRPAAGQLRRSMSWRSASAVRLSLRLRSSDRWPAANVGMHGRGIAPGGLDTPGGAATHRRRHRGRAAKARAGRLRADDQAGLAGPGLPQCIGHGRRGAAFARRAGRKLARAGAPGHRRRRRSGVRRQGQGATRGPRYDPDMGLSVRLSCSAAGHAWLSTLSDDAAAGAVAKQGLGDPRTTGRARRPACRAAHRLRATRRRGYAMVSDMFAPAMASMARRWSIAVSRSVP